MEHGHRVDVLERLHVGVIEPLLIGDLVEVFADVADDGVVARDQGTATPMDRAVITALKAVAKENGENGLRHGGKPRFRSLMIQYYIRESRLVNTFGKNFFAQRPPLRAPRNSVDPLYLKIGPPGPTPGRRHHEKPLIGALRVEVVAQVSQ